MRLQHTSKGKTPVPDRRVLIVLSSLVGAMTLASGLLLALEPRGSTGVRLQQMAKTADPVTRLFATRKPLDLSWTRVIIHDSGSTDGSADDLAAAHRQQGAESVGYHFVIDNGQLDDNGKPDIHPTARWSNQQDGDFLNAVDAQQQDQPRAIGICLIGDTNRQALSKVQLQQLVWLVQQLQTKLHISRTNVNIQTSGHMFPAAAFNGQLLSP